MTLHRNRRSWFSADQNLPIPGAADNLHCEILPRSRNLRQTLSLRCSLAFRSVFPAQRASRSHSLVQRTRSSNRRNLFRPNGPAIRPALETNCRPVGPEGDFGAVVFPGPLSQAMGTAGPLGQNTAAPHRAAMRSSLLAEHSDWD